jgi:hypothetical protein
LARSRGPSRAASHYCYWLIRGRLTEEGCAASDGSTFIGTTSA